MPSIDKRALLDVVLAQLSRKLDVLTASAKTTSEGATDEEAKPENDKDTRALEQSYLARGQAKRVTETREVLGRLRTMGLRSFSDGRPISISALVTVEVDGEARHYFVVPIGGGMRVAMDGVEVQLLSTSSPVGRALLNRQVGDTVELQAGGGEREYEIQDVQ